MVGFGFMDNIIMVQAGDFIDSTFGVKFGLSTLTAAALGNICSDTSGALFGGVVESFAARLQLPGPNFTPAQANLRVVQRWGTAGATAGIICGCLLGMTNLLFMDLDRSERLKKAAELDTIFRSVVENGHRTLGAERCTLFLYDGEKQELWTKVSLGESTDEPLIITLPLERNALACFAVSAPPPRSRLRSHPTEEPSRTLRPARPTRVRQTWPRRVTSCP